jgi:pilus assembly protein CpaC
MLALRPRGMAAMFFLTALLAWAGPVATGSPPPPAQAQDPVQPLMGPPVLEEDPPAGPIAYIGLSTEPPVVRAEWGGVVTANEPLRLDEGAATGLESTTNLSPAPPIDPEPPLALAMMPQVTRQEEDQPARPEGQPVKRADDQLIESIQVRGERTEQLVVPRNSSAVITLKQRVDGVEISDPNIADVVLTSPTRIIVSGKSYGTTQLVLRVGDQQRALTVTVELDLRMLANLIKSISPTSEVQLRSIGGTVVLTGRVPDVGTADRIAELASLAQGGEVRNQLTVAGVQQTMLRVVVAEVNKTALRELAVNWAIGGADWTRDFFFANNLNQLNPTVFRSNGIVDVTSSAQRTYSMLANANAAPTNVTFGFPRGEFQIFMRALRENQLARILAEPNLVAINGQTATFLVGGEVPIPVTQGGAVAGAITIEYKEFGVRLGFTPTVMAGQNIRLHVMSEVSDAVPGAVVTGTLPTFTFLTRRVESTIECGNGQTFAIAGLLREQVRSVADKLPGLGDLPVLGAMFSSVRYQKDDTELVVLVTPQLVEPLEPQQVVQPPGALMRDPNDYELFGLGQLEGTPQTPTEFEGAPRDVIPVNTLPAGGAAGDWATSQIALVGPWGLADAEE